jgi:RNA polymerase sigma-70 factor (ECF subfamily)
MDMTRREADDLPGDGATLRPETDVHLVTRARLGDHVAFGELVNRHHSTVRRVAHAILRSPAETDDVMQEAWLHVYLHLPRFQGTATFRTWVHAIVRNRAIDHRRSAQRRSRAHMRLAAVSIPDELGSRTRSPEALILNAERRERLTHAVAALPGPLREPLQLWHRGQHSYDEMARITGVTVGTIKSRVWEARQRVTHALSMSIAGRNVEPVKGS